MNNNAPDFSETIEMANDDLAEAEKRLNAKRRREQEKTGRKNKSKLPTENQSSEAGESQDVTPRIAQPKTSVKKTEPIDELVFKTESTRRRAFTLKVLEENEHKFHQLFHRLQLEGDSRRKQDLADEALCLLFEKYGSVL